MRRTLFTKKTTFENRGTLQLLVQALIMLFASSAVSQGQQPRPGQPLRDMVRAVERKEMDRLLDLKPLPATARDSEGRRAVLKQISEDFRDLQNLNNKMMAEAWAKNELDYRYISDMVSQIRRKATRLKSNLSLPEP